MESNGFRGGGPQPHANEPGLINNPVARSKTSKYFLIFYLRILLYHKINIIVKFPFLKDYFFGLRIIVSGPVKL